MQVPVCIAAHTHACARSGVCLCMPVHGQGRARTCACQCTVRAMPAYTHACARSGAACPFEPSLVHWQVFTFSLQESAGTLCALQVTQTQSLGNLLSPSLMALLPLGLSHPLIPSRQEKVQIPKAMLFPGYNCHPSLPARKM